MGRSDSVICLLLLLVKACTAQAEGTHTAATTSFSAQIDLFERRLMLTGLTGSVWSASRKEAWRQTALDM